MRAEQGGCTPLWLRPQANVKLAMAAEHEKEQERLRRERCALERQSRTLAKLPTRKERSEIEAMEAVVEQSRKEARAKDSRHKLTVERLRRQIVSLQVCARPPSVQLVLKEPKLAPVWGASKCCTQASEPAPPAQEQQSQIRDELQDSRRDAEALRAELAKKQKKKLKGQAPAASALPAEPLAASHVSNSAQQPPGVSGLASPASIAADSAAQAQHRPAPVRACLRLGWVR